MSYDPNENKETIRNIFIAFKEQPVQTALNYSVFWLLGLVSAVIIGVSTVLVSGWFGVSEDGGELSPEDALRALAEQPSDEFVPASPLFFGEYGSQKRRIEINYFNYSGKSLKEFEAVARVNGEAYEKKRDTFFDDGTIVTMRIPEFDHEIEVCVLGLDEESGIWTIENTAYFVDASLEEVDEIGVGNFELGAHDRSESKSKPNCE